MTSLSVSIMAHPKRRHLLPELHRRLGRPVPVVWDQRNDRWDTGRRSLLAFQPDATHHLVIQDDAVPAPGLLAAIEQVLPLAVEQDAVLCLYTGRVREHMQSMRHHIKTYPSWMQMQAIQWGVALVFPVAHIPAAVEHGDARTVPNYDSRLSAYWIEHGGCTLYPLPSWVQHAKTPSLIPGRSATRIAYRAVPDRGSIDATRWLNAPIYAVPDFVRRGAGAQPA